MFVVRFLVPVIKKQDVQRKTDAAIRTVSANEKDFNNFIAGFSTLCIGNRKKRKVRMR